MAFGFSIGDFIAVGDLAFRLYNDCYKIARGAPQEFQLLVNEISNLSNSMKILQNEAQDPESTLVKAGEDRVRMVNGIVKGIGETLKRLEKFAKKYEVLGSNSKGKHFWVKFKWSVEFSRIDGLRNKLVIHNTTMNLLLTSVGNSSLQRIESSNAFLGKDLEVIKAFISNYQAKSTPSAVSPAVSVVEDDVFKETLSAELMKNAEMTQPWSTIGVSQWLESGRWWLLIAQMQLSTVLAPRQAVPRAAYANLIKASWILIDIIACHPQMPFLSATTQADVRQLSAELKNEYSKISNLGAIVPDLSELESQDLRIWEGQTTDSVLRPRQDPRNTGRWKVAGGEQVLFQRYAACKVQALLGKLPCILLFLVHEDAKSARVVAQNQSAVTIMEVSFHKVVKSVLDGCSVTVNGEQISFAGTTDAEILEVLIEATNFYLFERNVDNANLEDLKAYALIFGVKNDFRESVARLSQMASSNGAYLKTDNQREPSVVAFSLASQPKTNKPEESLEQDYVSAYTSSFFGWAVYHGHTALVALLLSERVTWYGDLLRKAVSNEDREGLLQRTMKYVNYSGNEETAHLLLDNYLGAPNRNERESKALLESVRAELEVVVRLLFRRNEVLKSRDIEHGDNALYFATRQGSHIIVREMLELGCDIEAKNSVGMTPLMAAIGSSSEQVIALLLEKGANIDAKDNNGERVTHAALRRRLSKETVRLILVKAFEARLPSQLHHPKSKRRRAEVIVDMDESFNAEIFVDSYYASIEAPPALPYGVMVKHRKYLALYGRRSKPFGFKFSILFHAYPDAGLDISVRLRGSLARITSGDSPEERGRGKLEENNMATRFRIVNGGEFSVDLKRINLFESFESIATDPNAELVDSDIDSDCE